MRRNAWDHCKMEGLTLTQYVSKYRDVILKLNGLDDFQKVRGFLRGLDNEDWDNDYRTKVKTQNPQTLEDAIKGAQIYDDLSAEKQGFVRNNWGSKTLSSGNQYGKRKFLAGSSEQAKRPKESKGPLTGRGICPC